MFRSRCDLTRKDAMFQLWRRCVQVLRRKSPALESESNPEESQKNQIQTRYFSGEHAWTRQRIKSRRATFLANMRGLGRAIRLPILCRFPISPLSQMARLSAERVRPRSIARC